MAAGTAGRGRLRASHADREQVIGTLKAAFVQGLLVRAKPVNEIQMQRCGQRPEYEGQPFAVAESADERQGNHIGALGHPS